jgi:hypothetical protein
MARNIAFILTHAIIYAALSFSILQYLRFKGATKRKQAAIFALLTGGTLLSLAFCVGLLPAPP